MTTIDCDEISLQLFMAALSSRGLSAKEIGIAYLLHAHRPSASADELAEMVRKFVNQIANAMSRRGLTAWHRTRIAIAPRQRRGRKAVEEASKL